MDIKPVQVDLLFETSWEVCNKIGGIYTVLSTKAKTLRALYKDKVIFIGPDVWSESSPSPYFTEVKSLTKSWLGSATLPYGIKARAGRWNVPGRPIAILVSFDSMYAVKDDLYAEMWNRYGVDSLHAYGDYDEACAFSHAAGIVIESIYNHLGMEGKNVIAHFDEWTTGMGLLYTKWRLPRVATIFTTHATSIGRSICGNGKPLYDYLRGYNGDQMAGELNMQSKHSLEKAAAWQADCFTTVSDVTGTECAQLLDKRPDVVTPNGFEPNFVPAKGKQAATRLEARRAMLGVVSALTGDEYPDDTFIVATSGRCEYRNKGIDVYLDAVARTRGRLGGRRMVAFVMVPAWCAGARADLAATLAGAGVSPLPDLVITHGIHNPDYDPIYNRIRSLGFGNAAGCDVTVVYVPCYLNGDDGIFDMPYYDLLIGMDATVFPSYYEPWGYTPLESVAFGVPTLTTTLSGFGQWVSSDCGNDFASTGVKVVGRGDGNYDEVADTIASTLVEIATGALDAEALSKAAKDTAAKADWAHFITYYDKAFSVALEHERLRNEKNK